MAHYLLCNLFFSVSFVKRFHTSNWQSPLINIGSILRYKAYKRSNSQSITDTFIVKFANKHDKNCNVQNEILICRGQCSIKILYIYAEKLWFYGRVSMFAIVYLVLPEAASWLWLNKHPYPERPKPHILSYNVPKDWDLS